MLEDFSLVPLAGVSNPTTTRLFKNNLFAVQTNQIMLCFFSEFLKARLALANCLSSLKKEKEKKISCQCFEITEVIFHITITNCWLDKLCNRRELLLQPFPTNSGQPSSGGRLADIHFFPLRGR